jgi:hypothetical protein
LGPGSETDTGRVTGSLPMPVLPVSCGVGKVLVARLTDNSTPLRHILTNRA